MLSFFVITNVYTSLLNGTIFFKGERIAFFLIQIRSNTSINTSLPLNESVVVEQQKNKWFCPGSGFLSCENVAFING